MQPYQPANVPSQSFSAAFELQAHAQHGTLLLLTPLGSTAASVRWTAVSATLQSGAETQNSQMCRRGRNHLLGTDIPVPALFAWLDGQPLVAHDGWQVDLARRSEGKITARRPDANGRTGVDSGRLTQTCSMKSLHDICAPAKLNLFPHTGRRADGYHPLESAFMLIDWCDILHFELRLTASQPRRPASGCPPMTWCYAPPAPCSKPAAPAMARTSPSTTHPNVCRAWAAAHLMQPALLALNRLWGLNLDLATLLPIGLKLGADVPFFQAITPGSPASAKPCAPLTLPPASLCVVKPPQGLDTGRIFSHPQLKRDTEPAILSGFAADAYGFGRNNLQDIARQLCPGADKP